MYLSRPSILAHIFSGLITLYAIILYFNTELTQKENLFIVILFGILLTIHGISHFYLESIFETNTVGQTFETNTVGQTFETNKLN